MRYIQMVVSDIGDGQIGMFFAFSSLCGERYRFSLGPRFTDMH